MPANALPDRGARNRTAPVAEGANSGEADLFAGNPVARRVDARFSAAKMRRPARSDRNVVPLPPRPHNSISRFLDRSLPICRQAPCRIRLACGGAFPPRLRRLFPASLRARQQPHWWCISPVRTENNPRFGPKPSRRAARRQRVALPDTPFRSIRQQGQRTSEFASGSPSVPGRAERSGCRSRARSTGSR